MQIDFHHTVTYVCARMSGFSHKEADVISYCAQYVDDATNSGILKFNNGARYHRISSAHKILDRRNFSDVDNQRVWVPFHFLPGNDGFPKNENKSDSFIHKLVCKPDSFVVRELLDACRNDIEKPYGLHRLGITMHVYADTYAHQGFAGVKHKINEVNNLKLYNEDIDMADKLSKFFGDAWDSVKQKFVNDAFPLGHGAALTCPDKPYLKWSYTDGFGKEVERDNTEIFIIAVETMIGEMINYRNPSPDTFSFNEKDLYQIRKNFEAFTEQEGVERHKRWLESIANGDFSFGSVELGFIPKGEGSWKYEAVGSDKDIDEEWEEFNYHPEFLQSNWKMFHDALQAHYFSVINDILPKYGICAA